MISNRHVFVLKTKRPLRAVLVSCLVLMCLALVACGGDESAEPEAEATTVAVPTTVEEVADTAEVLPPTPLDPTAVPPTEAPAATDVPESPEPTYTPEPVDQGGGGIVAGGNCANPYFPVAEGASYRYRNSNSLTGETEYTLTYSELTNDTFVVTYNFDEGDEATTFSQTYQCTGEGILSPGPLQFPEEMGMEMEFEVVEASGLTLPAAARIAPGETWTTRYVVRGVGESEGMTFQWDQTMEFNNEIVAIESVSVPAGDYPAAVRIDSTGTISVVTTVGETETPLMSFDLDQSTWYVENVGMVRQEASDFFGESAEAASVVELVSIE